MYTYVHTYIRTYIPRERGLLSLSQPPQPSVLHLQLLHHLTGEQRNIYVRVQHVPKKVLHHLRMYVRMHIMHNHWLTYISIYVCMQRHTLIHCQGQTYTKTHANTPYTHARTRAYTVTHHMRLLHGGVRCRYGLHLSCPPLQKEIIFLLFF